MYKEDLALNNQHRLICHKNELNQIHYGNDDDDDKNNSDDDNDNYLT